MDFREILPTWLADEVFCRAVELGECVPGPDTHVKGLEPDPLLRVAQSKICLCSNPCCSPFASPGRGPELTLLA